MSDNSRDWDPSEVHGGPEGEDPRSGIWAYTAGLGMYPDAFDDAKRFHATLEATRFRQLLDSDWQWRMEQSPEWATRMGDHRYDDRLTDASP